jgi:hypothetical protein
MKNKLTKKSEKPKERFSLPTITDFLKFVDSEKNMQLGTTMSYYGVYVK